MSDLKELAARVEALELALAHQEQTIDDLNSGMLERDKEIMSLRRELAKVAELVANVSSHPALAEDDRPPPHY